MDFLPNIAPHGCPCGKSHTAKITVVAGKNALDTLPDRLASYQVKRIFLLADAETAGIAERVSALLKKNGLLPTVFVLPDSMPQPNEATVGSVVMHLPKDSEMLLGVGSGVINDIMKLVSHLSGKPYVIVATAPSMDGYASATSSMTRDGLKVSLPTRMPDLIIGDTDILRKAPMKSLISGLGDMLAKYVSLCEWRISHIINGEYYCPAVADVIRSALRDCVANADGLLRRDEHAVEAVFRGLVLGGLAMSYADCSRPASGTEHYISHILDMRHAVLGTPEERHGIQCALGTLLTVRLYDRLRHTPFDREKALSAVSSFHFNAHAKELRHLLGHSAEMMIAAEQTDRKYDPILHAARLEQILSHRDAILAVIDEELPLTSDLEALFDTLGLPKSLGEIGTNDALFPTILRATADIRDKYILPRLLFDLGLLYEFSERIPIS